MVPITELGAISEMDVPRAVSVSFLTLSISRLLHVFNMRSPESGLLDNEISRTPHVWERSDSASASCWPASFLWCHPGSTAGS